MKNLKPFVLGSFAGAGIMFVMLQYHVLQSHDGWQLVPRTPQPSLGLAWVDTREWGAEEWSERPELTRALVAHGASDLIAGSVAQDVTDALEPDSGTMGRLRSLLSDSMETDLDAPAWNADDADVSNTDNDNFVIPFPERDHEARRPDRSAPQVGEARPRTHVADSSSDRFDRSESDFGSGLGEFSPFGDSLTEADDISRDLPSFDSPVADSAGHSSRPASPFRSLSNDTDPESDPATARRREADLLEDLLFSSDSSESADDRAAENLPGLGTFTRELDSRASQALDRARTQLSDSFGDAGQRIQEQMREEVGGYTREFAPDLDSAGNVLPESIRSLREGFDPFLE